MPPRLYPEAKSRLHDAADRAERDPSYLSAVSGSGPSSAFEALLEEELDASFALCQTSGTSALETALLASGVGADDEVILPAYTWPQTLSPVLRRGATPVFADIAPGSLTISPESVRERTSSQTAAIIGAYLHGYPPPAPRLEEIAQAAGATLIFDAAQGFGATIEGKRTGAYGDYVALSFGRGKLLSVGEGGALLCRTRSLYERAVAVSQHPLRAHRHVDDRDRRRNLDGVATNARLSPLLAELAIGQLKGMRRAEVRERLHERFCKATQTIRERGLGPAFPTVPKGARPSGTEIPLLLEAADGEDVRPVLEEAIEGYTPHEGGLSEPLYATPTIRVQAFPLQAEGSPDVPFHETHRPGSCPRSETRCEKRQIVLTSTGRDQV